MAKAADQEVAAVLAGLERQPGVTSVVRGRYTRSRHHHQPGFVRIHSADAKTVHVRVYDKLGVRDAFVHAPASDLRDVWLGKLTGSGSVEALSQKPAPAKAVVVTGQSLVQTNEIKAELYDVTPDLAIQWLERNTRNRKLRQQVVNKYAADMRAGRWLVTGDAVAFDRNGSVVNGQHRLWAVVESGKTVQMMVAFGLDPDVVTVLDDHLKRSLGDVALIRNPGSTVTTLHTAVTTMLVQTTIRATAQERWKALKRVSRQTQLETMDRHWNAIEFAYRECFHSRRVKGLTQAAVLTPVARAYYSQDRERLRAFAEVVLTGMPESGEDQAAVLLRNVLMRGTGHGSTGVEDTYFRTERALRAFLDRQRISSLHAASEELFPLPEEQQGRK